MNRSIQRATLAALALSLVAITAAPANAATVTTGNTTVTTTITKQAVASWQLPTVFAADGSTVTTGVQVDAFVDASGVTRVAGGIVETVCTAEGDCSWDLNQRYFEGTPTTYTVNRNATGATIVGTFPSTRFDGVDWVASAPVAVSVTLSAASSVLFPSTFSSSDGGNFYYERIAISRSTAATAVGTIGGFSSAAGTDAYAEIANGYKLVVIRTSGRP